jgi:D-aspartate ligase
VQGLSNTRSLGEAGIPVFVVDKSNCIARHSKYCKKFFKCPPFESDELADFLIALAKKEEIRGWLLLPSNDHAVLTLSRNKAMLKEHYNVITPGLEIIQDIYDKSRLLSVAREVGVPMPATYYAEDIQQQNTGLRFPVLTKGRFGLDFYKAMGRKAFLSKTPDELWKHLALIDKHFPVGKTFTQELIPDDGTNKTISFAAFCDRGKILSYWMGEKIREHPARFGTATFARSILEPICYKQAIPLLRALNYTGVCEVEYLKDPRDGQYKLIEINARTWLWVELARQCGVDFARMAYDFMNQNHVNYPVDYDQTTCWINPFSDTVYAAQSMIRGNLRFKGYWKSLKDGKAVNALFYKNDNRPALQYLLNIGAFLSNR